MTKFGADATAVTIRLLERDGHLSVEIRDDGRGFDLGAMGFVPKRASNETLTEALKVVMSGGIYVPPMTMGGVDSGVAGQAREGSVVGEAGGGRREI